MYPAIGIAIIVASSFGIRNNFRKTRAAMLKSNSEKLSYLLYSFFFGTTPMYLIFAFFGCAFIHKFLQIKFQ